MSKTILNVKPISQLFPLPLVMGCEGVSAAMLLQYNHHTTKATDIMKNWPTHKIIRIKVMLVINYLLSLDITKRFFLKRLSHIFNNLMHASAMVQDMHYPNLNRLLIKANLSLFITQV